MPPAPQGIPVAWKGHYYGRSGESMVPLSIDKIEQIRKQVSNYEWSAQVIPNASIADLDQIAIMRAKEKFKSSRSKDFLHSDIDTWDDATFLEKAKITFNGGITNTAILLLGTPQSANYISPAIAQITWKLEGSRTAYQHFAPPFYLTVNSLYHQIRNIRFKHLIPNTIDAVEISKYDQWSILEALNNCIAHQDYSASSRIVVKETDPELTFINSGKFIEGLNPEDYIIKDKTPLKYRNPFLSQAMHNLGMIDTIGSGIKRIFTEQRRRYLPLPEYDFSGPSITMLKMYGGIIDDKYADLLIQHKDLDLSSIISLDRVQKRRLITKEEAKRLKTRGLIEGRYPNMIISATVAASTGEQARYVLDKGLDKQYYKQLILTFIRTNGSATRKQLDGLLLSKLPDVLSSDQKTARIKILLSELSSKDNKICNSGTKTKSNWVLK